MRKTLQFSVYLLTSIMLLAATNAFGQASQLPYVEDFEAYEDNDDFLANSGWTVIDSDGDGYNWFMHYDSWDDINLMVSRSYDSDAGALTPENYLVTPLISLGEGKAGHTIVLSFHVAASGANFYAEKYKIVISTTGNTKEDFDDGAILWEEVLSEDEGDWNFATREVDLSVFAGEEVHVAFVHFDCTDQGRLLVNNVKVEEKAPIHELPYAENFEAYEDNDDFLANSGWTVIDADGDGFNWFLHYDSWDDINLMVSRSWESSAGALTPKNYLITPKLSFPELKTGAGIFLYYDVAASDDEYFAEHYKVVVSTTGNEEADFDEGTVVFEETLTETESYWDFATREIDLSEFAGQVVYIAFVHYDCTDQGRLLINNVKVEAVEDEDHDLPFAENFETYEDTGDFLATSGWISIDADGDGNNWFLYETSDKQVMASESWAGGALTPENWLITPEIKFPGAAEGSYVVLSYEVAATGNNYYAEHYKVVISTTGSAAEDFSNDDIVFEETLGSAQRGSNFGTRHIDISDYAGETVYLAFVHYDSTDQDMLLLNNVQVRAVNSAVISPEVVEFNPLDPQEVATVITFFGATGVAAVHEGETILTEETDYVFHPTDDETVILALKASYLEDAAEGELVFNISFDKGDPVELKVIIGATPEDASIAPEIADFDPEDPQDMALTIEWGDAEALTAVLMDGEEVDEAHYNVEGDKLTLAADLFDEANPGYIHFRAQFNLGADASFIVRVFDHTVHSLPFEENFMGIADLGASTPEGWLPNGWRVLDADGDSFNWYWVPIIEDGEISFGRMQSRSSYQDETGDWVALTPDNWLITPAIELDPITAQDQEIELTFRVAPGASTPGFRREHYSVMVSYTDLDPESFVEVYSETISEDHPQNQLQERKVELSYYEGQTVYVVFRHHDVTDMDRLLFTEVKIEMHGEDDTGIADPKISSVLVFPNPARDKLSVRSDSPIRQISLIGMLGNVIYQQEVMADRYEINLAGFPEGTYLLRAITDQGVVVKRIQVIR